MPYNSNDELPNQTKKMPEHAKTIFRNAFNSALKEYGDEKRAFATAMAAVKHKYHQNNDGKWVENKSMSQENLSELSFFITKATISPNGEMLWAATCSDTEFDSYSQKMSLNLFNKFIEKFSGTEYVSLAHYPRLSSGNGEAGLITTLYIDGNNLKAKGIFHDTKLGRAVYNSIRADRRENIPPDKRVRVSIGFYDIKHQHGENGYIWVYDGIGTEPCSLCKSGATQGKIYLDGQLDHVAVTRIPVNKRTDIVTRSEDMTTRAEDAASIVPEEIVNDIEQEYRSEVHRSDTDTNLVIKSEVEYAQTIMTMKPVDLVQYLNKLKTDGKDTIEVSVDELINQVNQMLNAVTSKSESEDKHMENTLVEEAISQRKDVSPADKKRAEKEYGNVKYADEKNKKYPIDTEEHIRAAWNYINKEQNASKYSSEEVASIKRKIVAAWKEKIDKEGPPSAAKSEAEPVVQKDMMADGDMVMKPLAGATSLGEAKSYMETARVTDGMYKAFSLFGMVASNIMSDDCEVGDKLMKMQSLLAEFRGMLTPDRLKTLSENKESENTNMPVSDEATLAVKSLEQKLLDLQKEFTTLKAGHTASEQPKVEETPVITEKVEGSTQENTVPESVKAVVDGLQNDLLGAVQLSGTDRKVAMQSIIEKVAQGLVTVDKSLTTDEPVVEQPVVDDKISKLTDVVNQLASQVTDLSGRVAQMNSALAGKTTVKSDAKQPQKPTGKAVVSQLNTVQPSVPQQPHVNKSGGMSISEIAYRSTHLPDGRPRL